MGDLIFGILAAIGELFLELFIELVAESFFLMLSRAFEQISGDEEYPPLVTFVGYGAVGLIAGGVSLLLFPHPLIHPSRIHGISVIISPILTGLAMSWIGFTLKRRGKTPARIESFTYGFSFALGMALVRFFFVR